MRETKKGDDKEIAMGEGEGERRAIHKRENRKGATKAEDADG
jgi:hypothetical protein